MIRSFCVNYCDDIRSELGNKISLIGIYGADLLLPELPAVLPKLCIYAQVYGELETPLDGDVEVRVLLDDDVIASSISQPKSTNLLPRHFVKMVTHIILSPFSVEKESILRVRLYHEGKEYRASSLRIKSVSSSSESSPKDAE